MITTGKRWINLVIGTIVMMLLGMVYSWTIFVKPLEAEFMWQRSSTTTAFTVCMICFILGLISYGFIMPRFNTRLITVFAAIILLTGFFLCSKINLLWQLYIFYGVFIGLGVGISYNSVMSTIIKWFPDKKGIISGILTMGFGLGGFILSPSIVKLIASFGWRQTFLFLAFGLSFFVALASFATVLPSKEFLNSFNNTANTGSKMPQDIPPSKTLKTPTFWFYFLWSVLIMSSGLLVLGHASLYATDDLGVTVTYAGIATGILSLANGFGRVLTGLTYDKFGIKKSMLATSTYTLIAAVILLCSSWLHSVPLMILGFIFTGFSYGGAPATGSVFTMEYYGAKYFPLNYAFSSSGMIPSAILGPMMASFLFETFSAYTYSFIFMVVLGAVSLMLVPIVHKKRG